MGNAELIAAIINAGGAYLYNLSHVISPLVKMTHNKSFNATRYALALIQALAFIPPCASISVSTNLIGT